MKDLENDLDDEDEFEIDNIPTTSTSRPQSRRSCTVEKIVVSSHSETSDDEPNSSDTSSQSNSDWYKYPESDANDDSISNSIRDCESSPEIDFDINYD